MLVETIDAYSLGPPDRNGLHFGYADLTLDASERGAMVVAGFIRGC